MIVKREKKKERDRQIIKNGEVEGEIKREKKKGRDHNSEKKKKKKRKNLYQDLFKIFKKFQGQGFSSPAEVNNH